MTHTRHRARRIHRSEDGAALVDFALLLPLLVIMFGVTVEGARIFWGYQNVAAGVRDAARYVARIAPQDTCSGATPSLAAYQDEAEDIIKLTIDGNSPFIPGISVTNVSVSHSCETGTYRRSPVTVAQVTADVSMTLPFGGLISLGGGTLPGTISTSIFDQSRVFGQ